MSDFASAILTSHQGDWTQLESELENELPARVDYQAFTVGVNYNVTSTYATISSLTATLTVEADEIILMNSNVSVSCATAGDKLAIQHFNGASAAGLRGYFTEFSNATSGDHATVSITTRYIGLSGSIAFSTKWTRASGTGLIYALEGSQTITIMKKRA